MGFGSGLLKLTSSLAVIVSMALVGVAAYTYSKLDAHVADLSLVRLSSIGSLFLGVIIFIFSILGYVGASSQSRCLLSVFFACLQVSGYLQESPFFLLKKCIYAY